MTETAQSARSQWSGIRGAVPVLHIQQRALGGGVVPGVHLAEVERNSCHEETSESVSDDVLLVLGTDSAAEVLVAVQKVNGLELPLARLISRLGAQLLDHSPSPTVFLAPKDSDSVTFCVWKEERPRSTLFLSLFEDY